MKIQCDVCDKYEASVFCVADEAALCAACDHRVHHANKLAGKHQRFSLIQPSPKQFPVCDICQKKRAFLFCQQDRAILCRECDIPIHKANEHTQKHNRFLLTGVKLSSTSALYSSSSTSTESSITIVSDSVLNIQSQTSLNKPVSISVSSSISETPTNPPPFTAKTTSSVIGSADGSPPPETNDETGGNTQLINCSTTSISEYLIDTLPGWHVEDFLDSSSSGFFKTTENDVSSFLNADLESNQLSAFSQENTGFWVPQAPHPLYYPPQIQSYPTLNMAFGAPDGLKEPKEISNIKSSRKWSSEDNSFAVPQINPYTAA
ncbi:B-box zinc finger protein 20-like [Olea europaea var. sylvestris]|uniref:B-box zinc finger 21-like n=1 Tax=Olea europaea subsp. europaea TaxID=158383 RepID=A0A8S0T2R6_OLEEU|nr:B-box zinc finger protein 20-like [Olea europaea var. sylvestris]XP_022856970.1 B-box zinc finger protein 20-like [Olea europaea var. sylvestris]CAA2998006.1 B-box zinc finger 21-like [Olea europaea subsp. europaea]